MPRRMTYKEAGVDIDKANRFVEMIKPLIKATNRKEVMSSIGGFGGLFHLDTARFKKPILVSSTDGVGTKLRIAQMVGKHDTIGIDLVAMSVNDVIVQGAEPLFFLDYMATGKIDEDKSVKIIEGIAKGCQEAGCALIGGETAEMPGFYKDDEYDLAGFCVGVADEGKLINGSTIRAGDVIIGLASSGLHSNGFSLARKVLFSMGKLSVHDRIPELPETLGMELLRPTRIYVKPLLNLIKNFTVRGIVHITGGGFVDNIPRIVRGSLGAVITGGSWTIPPIFQVIQTLGSVDEAEMLRVFNMGIGLVLVVPKKESKEVLERLEQMGERAYRIGVIEKRHPDQPSVVFI